MICHAPVRTAATMIAVPTWGHAAARARAAGDADAAAFLASRRYLHLPSGRVAYAERGRGGPTVIFLHGWPLSGYQWRGAMARLAADARCIAPDFLGLGDTVAPAEAELSPLAQARMIGALMDHLGVQEAHLVANGSGTAVALMVAARRPDRIHSLLLTNGDVGAPRGSPAVRSAARCDVVRLIERHLTEPGYAQSRHAVGGLCYAEPATLSGPSMEAYFRPLLATPLRRQQVQACGAELKPSPLPPLAERLALLETPVRIVWATDDARFPPAWAEWLDRALPGSRGVRWVDDAKLFFPEERPDLIAAEARALWEAE